MKRHKDYLSRLLCLAVWLGAGLALCAFLFIISYILLKGLPQLSPELFAWEYNSENVSLTPALLNTLLMVALALLLATPVGIGAAVYLAEYAKSDSKLAALVGMAAETLAGIPSIVYGLFGALFSLNIWGWVCRCWPVR